ncbi:MAG: N-acetylmuramoyl-L-alanine amidase [Bacteroidales bacterium]|nr:N-acetylmuramoyl-L-alanine amidase [Bacteroidales bacterium]
MTRQTYPLWIDRRSFEPGADMELLPDEVVRVSFTASKGQEAYVDVHPGKISLKCMREDHDDYSVYRAELPLRGLSAGKSYTMSVRIVPAAVAPVKDVYRPDITRTVVINNPEDYPLVKVKNEYSRLVYNLGAPRLGGPIRSELSPGAVLKTSGKIGDNYRIRLSNVETGFINEADVEVMSGSRLQPSYIVTSMTCGPSNGADIVSIPYPEPVAYEVYPDPDQKRLIITIFGAESASTWVTHRKGCRMIDKLTWEQSTPETFRVFVNLKSENIWGYDIRPSGRSLVLSVKYPPVYDLTGEKPLTGLKIAIEAGHGGSGMGAIGLSGLVEKDINLDLSFMLGDLCRSMGAEIVQVRDSDKDMLLLEKRNIAISSGADMLISIHANAGGRGYLSVAGTSTYWHNPFWAPLAQTIYDRLLETGLPEFGVLGSFNYTVTRVSQIPSILVEQAFMTNAEDEEKLADPLFRQKMAQKIYEGIIDYLRQL